MYRIILLVLCLITGISSKAADDSSLIFKAGFDNISVRAEKAAGCDGRLQQLQKPQSQAGNNLFMDRLEKLVAGQEKVSGILRLRISRRMPFPDL